MLRTEIDKYYDCLTATHQSGEMDFALNKDRAHNVMVMRLLLNTSNSISMYCGKMSVFRQKFYDYISMNNTEKGEEPLGDYLKSLLVEEMNRFLMKKDAKLQIIVEKKDNEDSDELIFGDEFKQGVEEKKVEIFYLSDNMLFKDEISHFALSNTVIRMEKDRKERSAICAINPPKDLVNTMLNHFNTLMKMSTRVA